jgi:hypothetical protein
MRKSLFDLVCSSSHVVSPDGSRPEIGGSQSTSATLFHNNRHAFVLALRGLPLRIPNN